MVYQLAGSAIMEFQDLFNIGLGFIASVFGWFARTLWEAVQNLKEDLYNLKTEIAKDYIRKDDFSDFKTELFSMLHRIEDKIERKQDK